MGGILGGYFSAPQPVSPPPPRPCSGMCSLALFPPPPAPGDITLYEVNNSLVCGRLHEQLTFQNQVNPTRPGANALIPPPPRD